MSRKLKYKIIKFIITKETGILSGKTKCFIKWRVKFVPFMGWVSIKEKTLSGYKPIVFDSISEARKGLEVKIEKNELQEASYFNG